MPDSELTVDVSPSAEQALFLGEVCARFEAAWTAAGPTDPAPRIENFLAGSEQPERAVLLHRLVLLDVNHRRRRGFRACLLRLRQIVVAGDGFLGR